MDLNTFDVSLGLTINLQPYINNQPLCLVAKSQSMKKTLFVVEFDYLYEDDTQKEHERSKTSDDDVFEDAIAHAEH